MTHYDLRHEADGWWCVYCGGVHLCDEFLTVEEAERAIERYEREDEEAEREARDDADRGDWEFHRDYDQ